MEEIKDNRATKEINHPLGNQVFKEQECLSCKLKKLKWVDIIKGKIMLLINWSIISKDSEVQKGSLNQMGLELKCDQVEAKEDFVSSLSYSNNYPKEL